MVDYFVGTICTIISSCTVAYFTYWLNSKDEQNKWVPKLTKNPISRRTEKGGVAIIGTLVKKV
ncbi:type I toxin-antitoxin system Fst family toxin [Macrococcus hajekii]|uniref:Type I toxin-antitoxin system Fst family toxin n=1 Tax=Macrococcus hajekii TaxID=198482 RepID=A0A4R6BJG7_9STAP|nr:type I toxin-antitoxin system Fst family toxin [Macrococcus hajekii]TDM01797.1 type I toxin-antitoxin system Fst family toxin [Macrococcus hajekii]GGB07555.1 hypothetical protein GCM10007190_14430 [Macrococcus hajekii]